MFNFFRRLFGLNNGRDKSDIGRLVGACFGDRKKAERLITYEMQRAKITYAEALQCAIDRLERDRGR